MSNVATRQPLPLDQLHALIKQIPGMFSHENVAHVKAIIDRLYTLHDAALAWAQHDQLADDLAAEVHAAQRVIDSHTKPVPQTLIQRRDDAAAALHKMCQTEYQAIEHLHEVARSLLVVNVGAAGASSESDESST